MNMKFKISQMGKLAQSTAYGENYSRTVEFNEEPFDNT